MVTHRRRRHLPKQHPRRPSEECPRRVGSRVLAVAHGVFGNDRRPVLMPAPDIQIVRHQEMLGPDTNRVTLFPGISEPRLLPDHEMLPHGAFATLTLEQQNERTRLAVTAGQLELGVLLGRYARCDVRTRGLPMEISVSRVHALLIKDGDRVQVIDTASTWGTQLDGMPVAVGDLGEEALLQLAPGNFVRWRRV
jgi:hypothetical protein